MSMDGMLNHFTNKSDRFSLQHDFTLSPIPRFQYGCSYVMQLLWPNPQTNVRIGEMGSIKQNTEVHWKRARGVNFKEKNQISLQHMVVLQPLSTS